MQNNANKKRPAESRSMILLTTVKQRFNIQLVRQVQIRLPLKNLMVKKNKTKQVSSFFLCDADVHISGQYSTHLSMKVHKRFCDIRMIPWTCKRNRRSDKTHLRLKGNCVVGVYYLAEI